MTKASDPLAIIVGKNITERREKLGFSKNELAAKLEITLDAMRRMESGGIGPKMSRLLDIAEHLQCSVPSLFHVQHEETADRATFIAEILKPMPPNVQDALVELIVQSARVLGYRTM